MTPKENVKHHTVTSLLNDIAVNLNDHDDVVIGPVTAPVTEMNVTVNFKTEEGVKGTILAAFDKEGGLSVYERYGSVERYDALCSAFQTEVDHYLTSTLNGNDVEGESNG